MTQLNVSLEKDCNCDKSNPATYNAGNGEDNMIMMYGPLGNAYTQALSVYFQKEPLGEEVSANNEIAAESQSQDAILASAAAAHIEKQREHLARVQLVTQSSNLIKTPQVIAYVVPAKDSLSPETVVKVSDWVEKLKATDRQVIMVCDSNESRENWMGRNANYVPDGDIPSSYEVGQSFTRATEDYYEKLGVPVVFGMEGFVDWVAKYQSTNIATEGIGESFKSIWKKLTGGNKDKADLGDTKQTADKSNSASTGNKYLDKYINDLSRISKLAEAADNEDREIEFPSDAIFGARNAADVIKGLQWQLSVVSDYKKVVTFICDSQLKLLKAYGPYLNDKDIVRTIKDTDAVFKSINSALPGVMHGAKMSRVNGHLLMTGPSDFSPMTIPHIGANDPEDNFLIIADCYPYVNRPKRSDKKTTIKFTGAEYGKFIQLLKKTLEAVVEGEKWLSDNAELGGNIKSLNDIEDIINSQATDDNSDSFYEVAKGLYRNWHTFVERIIYDDVSDMSKLTVIKQ